MTVWKATTEWKPKIGTKVVATLRDGVSTIEGKVVALDRQANGEWATVQYMEAGVRRSTRVRLSQLSKPVKEAA